MRLLLLLTLLATNVYAQPTAIVGQIHKTVATAGTPLQLSSTALYVKYVCLQCSFANTGTSCYVGNSAANAEAAKGLAMSKPTATVSAQPICFGDLNNAAGPKINLAGLWVDVATSADEVNAFYIE